MRISGMICGAVIASVALLASSQAAYARPDYNKAFWALYEKELGKMAESTKCNACHYGQEKKNRNDYGKAVGEAIMSKDVGGKPKNEKDADKIKKGLEKAAKEKSSTEGKTFGDLIKDGKLPGKNPE